MKLKNSNMERSDLLCPGGNQKNTCSVYGAQAHTVLKLRQWSKLCIFPVPSSCILAQYISPILIVFSLFFSLFSTFCAHFSMGQARGFRGHRSWSCLAPPSPASSSSHHGHHVATVKQRELQELLLGDADGRRLVKATGST